MILNFAFIVLSILLVLVFIGVAIGGLIKKKKKLWVTSLILTVVFIATSIFSIAYYVESTIDYVISDEFQEDTKRSAESLGKTWGNTVSGTAKGLEETLDEGVILKLANKGAKIVGNGVKVIAAGFDDTVGKTKIFSDKSLTEVGVNLGRAELINDSTKISYGLFLEFSKDYEGTLELVAYDNEGFRMDRALLKVFEQKGAAKVVVFQFDYFKPGLSGYCILTSKNNVVQ